MRILWVKAGKLLPVDTGGKIRSFNLLKQLAARNELVLLSYYGDAPDPSYDARLQQQFPGAETIYTGVPDASVFHYARHLLSVAPYAVTKFTSSQVKRVVGAWLNARRFDVAVCDFLSASLNFPKRSPTPCVLFQHNVESILWRRQAVHEPNRVKRWVFALEALKMDRYERAAVRRFPHVIAVSERDRDEMLAMTAPERLSVVPTGVDVAEYGTAAGADARKPIVMFLGSMDWEANIDAVEHFCRDIWPAVRAAVPSAQFRIVGRNPHARVARLAGDSVEVTGTVPSVVEHLKEAAVVVVPLRVGGGTRLKIFEAMSMAKAVVSTTIGAEGLPVTAGRDLEIADEPARFAQAVVRLMRDAAARRAIEAAARQLVVDKYDWSAVALDFEAALVATTDRRKVRRVAERAIA
jgi:glycosyltransferase involved in cell wall biosynthesis